MAETQQTRKPQLSLWLLFLLRYAARTPISLLCQAPPRTIQTAWLSLAAQQTHDSDEGVFAQIFRASPYGLRQSSEGLRPCQSADNRATELRAKATGRKHNPPENRGCRCDCCSCCDTRPARCLHHCSKHRRAPSRPPDRALRPSTHMIATGLYSRKFSGPRPTGFGRVLRAFGPFSEGRAQSNSAPS